jgi:hypothetical protein
MLPMEMDLMTLFLLFRLLSSASSSLMKEPPLLCSRYFRLQVRMVEKEHALLVI